MPVNDSACFFILSPGVSRHENILFNTYYWFRVVCVHIVPCTSLVVLNSALVGAMRTAQRRRNQLLCRRTNPEGDTRPSRLDHNQASTSAVEEIRKGQGEGRTGSLTLSSSNFFRRRRRRLVLAKAQRTGVALRVCSTTKQLVVATLSRAYGRDQRRVCSTTKNLDGRTGSARPRLPEGSSTTMMLVIVVGVFLLVETPLAVFLVIMIADNTFGSSVLTEESRDSASLYLNLFTLVSYPVNFFIYCAMSQQFRLTFRGLFTPSAASVTAAVSAPEGLCGSEIDNEDHVDADVQVLPLDCVEMVCHVDANRPSVVQHQINGCQ